MTTQNRFSLALTTLLSAVFATPAQAADKPIKAFILAGQSGSSASGIREANTAARHAAKGRLAHQMCSVEMCPCRIDFSRADCSETSFSGRATSISRFSMSERRSFWKNRGVLRFWITMKLVTRVLATAYEI